MPQQQLTKSISEAAVLETVAARKIRTHRKAHKLSAAALAEQLGVSDVTVLYWESGQRTPGNKLQGKLLAEGICSPNDWHQFVPVEDAGEPGTAANHGQ